MINEKALHEWNPTAYEAMTEAERNKIIHDKIMSFKLVGKSPKIGSNYCGGDDA